MLDLGSKIPVTITDPFVERVERFWLCRSIIALCGLLVTVLMRLTPPRLSVLLYLSAQTSASLALLCGLKKKPMRQWKTFFLPVSLTPPCRCTHTCFWQILQNFPNMHTDVGTFPLRCTESTFPDSDGKRQRREEHPQLTVFVLFFYSTFLFMFWLVFLRLQQSHAWLDSVSSSSAPPSLTSWPSAQMILVCYFKGSKAASGDKIE